MYRIAEIFAEGVALQLTVGSAVLAVTAYLRFGTAELRSHTTALRYHSTASAYCLMALFLYYMIAFSPRVALQAMEAILGIKPGDTVTGMVDQLPPAVFALLLVLALPQIPKVSALDGRVRGYFQRLANIPLQAQLLSARLAEGAFAIDDKLSECVRKRLVERGFSSDDIDDDSETARRWRELSAMCLRIERLRSDKTYGAFHALCAKSVDALMAQWDREMPAARAAIRRRREIDSLRGDLKQKVEDEEFRERIRQEIDDILGDYEAAFLRRLGNFRKQVCDLVSRAVLMSFPSQRQRAAASAALGFGMRRPVGIGGDQLLFASLLVLLAVAGLLALKEALYPVDGHLPIGVLAVLVTAVHVIAVGFAVLSQQPETIRIGDPLHRRPYLHYLRIGLLSAGLASPLPVTAILVVQASGGALPAIAFIGFLPICLISGGFAAITAFNIDNGVQARPAWAGRVPVERLSEGFGQGLAEAIWTFLIISFVLLPMTQAVGLSPQDLMGAERGEAPPEIAGVPLPPLVIQFVAGSIVGYFVPTMYREAYAEVGDAGTREQAGQPVAAAAPAP